MTSHAHSTRRPARRRTARLLAAAAAISMTAVLAACSSGGGSDGESSSAGADRELGAMAPAEDSGAGTADRESTGSSGSGSKTATTGRNRAAVAVQRHVISQGTVSLVGDDVRDVRREVQRVVDAQGGEVTEEETETDEDGEALYARIVLRVPAGRFGDAMAALEGVADLRSSTRTSEDVTTQVIDTDVRVRAQRASLERVEQLLARAQGLRDIIWIESQLTTRQAELDSLEQQQAWLADQTRDSTIVVDIGRTPAEEPQEESQAGFLAGLGGGLEALGAVAVGLATVVGALLPFAAVLLLLGLPVWWGVRRSARRRRTPSATA